MWASLANKFTYSSPIQFKMIPQIVNKEEIFKVSNNNNKQKKKSK